MNYRIAKLREYLFGIIDELVKEKNYQINADFLGNIGDFSLDKIPTESTVKKFIVGTEIHRDVYSFRNRKFYSDDIIANLNNIGFFEDFETIIKDNNKKRRLPDINGIESIECLNCGTLINVDGTRATFDIQIQITYSTNNEREVTSL